jgi:hypothetical protein
LSPVLLCQTGESLTSITWPFFQTDAKKYIKKEHTLSAGHPGGAFAICLLVDSFILLIERQGVLKARGPLQMGLASAKGDAGTTNTPPTQTKKLFDRGDAFKSGKAECHAS